MTSSKERRSERGELESSDTSSRSSDNCQDVLGHKGQFTGRWTIFLKQSSVELFLL
jgi:hypothetical protein